MNLKKKHIVGFLVGATIALVTTYVEKKKTPKVPKAWTEANNLNMFCALCRNSYHKYEYVQTHKPKAAVLLEAFYYANNMDQE